MKKMNLNGLKVQSFITSLENTNSLRGGTESETREQSETLAACYSIMDCTVPQYCTGTTTRATVKCHRTTTTGGNFHDTEYLECFG